LFNLRRGTRSTRGAFDIDDDEKMRTGRVCMYGTRKVADFLSTKGKATPTDRKLRPIRHDVVMHETLFRGVA